MLAGAPTGGKGPTVHGCPSPSGAPVSALHASATTWTRKTKRYIGAESPKQGIAAPPVSKIKHEDEEGEYAQLIFRSSP
jgi:hypothetical protein